LAQDDVREEKVNELFRIFHNIKSATSFLKLERIHLLAELSEEVMESLRSGTRSVDDEIIDWLLIVSDQMRQWYEEISTNRDLSSTDPRIIELPE
jgi:two-component system chemotaxis sensor kinase CheA